MQIKKQYFVLGVFLVAMIFSVLFSVFRKEHEDLDKTERRLRYTLAIKNTSRDLIKYSAVKIFSPLNLTSSQRVKKITSTHDYTLIADDIGNQILSYKITVPPYGTKIIDIDVLLEVGSIALDANDSANPLYLANGPYINLDNPKIINLAKKLSGGSTDNIASKVVQWIQANIKNENYIKEDKGAAFALENLRGDCTEYSYLFTALLRKNGIAARVIGGFKVKSDTLLKSHNYHNWAEYYNGNSWITVDPQAGTIGEDVDSYIAFRIIVDAELTLMSSSHRFMAFDNRLKVTLK
ncbi:MAG: transglutaminase domain-containing protein [Bdellovibrionales bacterium]|nr:transglutaminase domain-containing protein [Bdellovibrionales bacterium]